MDNHMNTASPKSWISGLRVWSERGECLSFQFYLKGEGKSVCLKFTDCRQTFGGVKLTSANESGVHLLTDLIGQKTKHFYVISI